MDEDLELVNRTAAGERDAFDELVRKYQKPLYSLLYRMVSDHDDAADLLQKSFVKAFTAIRTFERRSTFKTWLYRIAINLAKNVYRDRSRFERVSLDDIVIRRDPRTLEKLISGQNRMLLHRAMHDLPEKQRITLLLRVQSGKTFEEISNIMECAVGTAKANYHHAVQKLKALLDEQTEKDGDDR